MTTTTPTTKWEAKANAKAKATESETNAAIDLRRANAELERQAKTDKIELESKRATARAEQREKRRNVRAERLKRVAAGMARLRERAAADIAGAASGVVYIVALGSAAVGQMSSAYNMGVPAPAGLAATIYLEGGAVAAAMTEHRARVVGNRAPIAKMLKWLLTAAAAGIQIVGHVDQPLLAAGLAIASIVAVVVFEMRSGQKAREAERQRLGRDRARFGFRRWLVAPISTVRAWRTDVLTLSATPEAAEALSVADKKRRTRRQERTHAQTVRADRRAIRTAIRRGHLKPDTDTNDADSGNADSTTVDVDGVRYIMPVVPDTIPEDWRTDATNTIADIFGVTTATATDTQEADTFGMPSSNTDSTVEIDTPDSADTTESDSTVDADTKKPRRTRRQTARKPRTSWTADTEVSDADMRAAAKRLGQSVSVRRLRDEAGCSKHQAEKWLKKNPKKKN